MTRRFTALAASLVLAGSVCLAAAGPGSASAVSGVGVWTPTSNGLSLVRDNFRATTLPDGRVLVEGGFAPGSYTPEAEVYDPATNAWTVVSPMHQGRGEQSAVLLDDGRVLVAGGYAGPVLYSAEIFDPSTGQWQVTGSMHVNRTRFAAVRLCDGRVLAAGGWNGGGISSAEIYDPSTGQWTLTGSLPTPVQTSEGFLLPDCTVLIPGATQGPGNGTPSAASYIFHPDTGTFTATASMHYPRTLFSGVQLPDGRIMVMGGDPPSSSATAEVYDPATHQWSVVAPMHDPHILGEGEEAQLLPDGRVLVPGDTANGLEDELYDPATNTWSFTRPQNAAHYGGVTALLHDGRVLNAGGGDSSGTLTTIGETYSPDSDLAMATPADITANATSSSGATVSYPLPAVTDPDDATAPAPDCSPAPGKVFGIGTTTVTCTATDPDDANSPITTSFTITVKGAAAQLADLSQAVQGVGPGTSLADKIAQAQAYLAAGDITDASATLDAFIHEVTAQSGKSIPAGQAAQLIADARRIQAVIRPTVFVLVQGIDSSLTSSDIAQQVTPGFDSVKSAIQAEYPNAQFLTFSYAGSTKKGAPLSYGCVSTLTTPLGVDIQLLGRQLQAVLAEEPNADVYLVAHSMGGIVAYGYMSALEEATGIVASLPHSNLKGVITLDSPIGGISNDPAYLGDAVTFYEANCPGFTGEDPFALLDMSTIFSSADLSTPPDSNAADPQGAQASILSIKFPNSTVPQPYPSNQKAAEDASANGIAILTVGNTNDLLWRPSECVSGQQDFTSTQWLEDEGNNSGIYAREFTSGILNCVLSLTLNQANHLDVLTDSGVMHAIQEFIGGATPASLNVAPPGQD